MGRVNRESLGLADCPGPQAGVCFFPSSSESAYSSSRQPLSRGERDDEGGDRESPPQRSSGEGGPNPGHIFPHLFGPQTRRRLAPSYKPQAFEQFSESRAFQDGKSDVSARPPPEWQSHGQSRFKGCVPIHHQDRKFLRFSWEQEVFQFRSLPFGLASAPRTFTKLLRPLLALLRSQGLRMVVYLDDILLMASSEELIGQHLTLLVSWLEELGFIINKDKSVMEPGHQIEFLGLTVNSNTMSLSVPQDKIAKVQKECRHMLNRGVASARELSHLIGLLSSLIWAVYPAPLHYRALQRLKHRALTSLGSWDLQVSLDSSSQRDLVFWVSQLKEHNGRSLEFPVATMIISSDASRSGWGAYSSISSVGGYWSPAEWDLHINALELKAAFLALKSLASHQRDCYILLLLDNITAISFINHKGGYEITYSFRPGTGNVDLVPAEGHHCTCRASTRLLQYRGRQDFTPPLRFERLEAGPLCFSEISESLGPVRHRLVHGQTQFPALPILQLHAGSRGLGHGCSSSELGGAQPLCLSSILSDWENPPEDEAGTNEGTGLDCSSLAVPGVVPSVTLPASGCPTPTSPLSLPTVEPTGSASPTGAGGNSPVSRLESVRHSEQFRDLSDETFQLISAAWRRGTEKSYNSAWSKWRGWCTEREINPILPPIEKVLEFLTAQFKSGLQYSTLNSYRSSLSATIPPIEGSPVGQHPLVVRLMQGIFNSRPPQPKYSEIWEVSLVLDHIRSELRASGELSLKDLSRKTVMLLALAMAARSSDLHLLDLRFMSDQSEFIRFQIAALTKTRRSGPPRGVTIKRLIDDDQSLCPVSTLRVYLTRTASLRQGGGNRPNPLFISFRKPNSPVSAGTIARWIKSLLQDSGIDTDSFSAHSTRAAATSAAKRKGLATADILKMAGWSRVSTFERFYFKPTPSNNMGLLLVSL